MPILNYYKDEEDSRDFVFRDILNTERLEFAKTTIEVPSIVDYRPYMSPVKNQGRLGSCVGFAVTALKEFQENVEYETERNEGSDYVRDKDVYDLSEQWVYWNTKKIDPWGPSVEGTSIRFALKVLHKIGVPPEEAWKYTDNKIDIGKPESWSHLVARWNKIDSYWRLKAKAIKQITSAILHTGPVVLGVGCYEEIFRPQPDGFVPLPRNPRYCYGGHAILACGYDDQKQRILFKNSWGTRWGDGGYGWFGYNYISRYCWDAWATKDARVTKAMLKGKISLQ